MRWCTEQFKRVLARLTRPSAGDPELLPRWGVMEGGKPAETRFRVLESLGGATFLELQPITGRTNQLRIHCAHIGHPIVGDEMHGNFGMRIANFDSMSRQAVNQRLVHDQFAIQNARFEIRLCLHAWKLSFHHPATGEWMEFSSPIPPEITVIMEALRTSPSL